MGTHWHNYPSDHFPLTAIIPISRLVQWLDFADNSIVCRVAALIPKLTLSWLVGEALRVVGINSSHVNNEQPTGVTGQHEGLPLACGTSSVSNRLGILCGGFSSLGASREEWPWQTCIEVATSPWCSLPTDHKGIAWALRPWVCWHLWYDFIYIFTIIWCPYDSLCSMGSFSFIRTVLLRLCILLCCTDCAMIPLSLSWTFPLLTTPLFFHHFVPHSLDLSLSIVFLEG